MNLMHARTIRSISFAAAIFAAAAAPVFAEDDAPAPALPESAPIPLVQDAPKDSQETVKESPPTRKYNNAATNFLLSAAKEGNAPKVSTLLKKGANPAGEDGEAFCNAALEGDIEVMRVLLDEGHIDPNIREGEALSLSASKGHADIVQLLLDRGMNPDGVIKDGGGNLIGRPLASAASGTNGDNRDSIENHKKTIAILLKAGAHLNQNNGYPLAHTAKIGSLIGVKLLIEQGADINADGVPLYAAFDSRNLMAGDEAARIQALADSRNIVKFMLENKGDINFHGGMPLQVAIGALDIPIIDAMIEEGKADVNAGEGAVLRAAMEKGNVEIINHLITKGANPNLPAVTEALTYMDQFPEKYKTDAFSEIKSIIISRREKTPLEESREVEPAPVASAPSPTL